ncbi:DUF58 domain-containing protein [Shewanella xiamenensis]|uniref:DUF58 domain-containing protein n=1 Tax=Shewanella xiamenensis TaxID=332186 RepID=UPI001C4F4953|nr:DUF58 domain-containing protein [Shewanella xiamenensis]MBW0282062.1 hypothetical protein [Shewanella xiamenensis]MCT8871663.1 DUF58 domain-containing protein [Shewanella xiamenensis]UWH43499.1 DUF58 domain-containing protein [Shewanella xiamenensis]
MNNSALNASLHNDAAQHGLPLNGLPLFADGLHLTEKELLACQTIARAIPERHSRARANLAGHRSSLIKGRGMEFAEVRHYQQGDDVRTIDWRVTARTGQTHTKLFIEERERPILLLLDLSQSLYFGSSLLLQSVQAGHLATTLGWNAINHGDRLGALIACESEHLELKPRSRRQGILQLISGLRRVHEQQLNQLGSHPRDPDHILRACQRLQRIAKPGSLIWIITDGSHFTPQCIAPLTELKRHCDIGAYLITDPLRQGNLNLPKQFSLPVRDGEQDLVLTRHSYQAWLALQHQQQNDFITMMQKLRVHTQFIDAGLPLAEQLALLQ